ncbi:MAG: hypothetical protein IJ009_04055 [Clostridia bacterium]|nr:hypothetical protein [Clostridia bacterium]
MVIGDKKTFLAYRCPHCGGGVIGICGDFALAGGRMLKLRCPCGESSLSANEASDGKIRLTVPCLLCAGDHHYLVSKSVFYSKELFLLNCAYTNLDVCFIGDEKKIGTALDENEKELKKILTDAGISSLAQLHGGKAQGAEDALPDTQVLDIVRFLVRDLEEEGRIDCPCHNGEYEVAFVEGGVLVYCLNCEGRHFFPVCSVEAAQDLLSCDSLILSGEGE